MNEEEKKKLSQEINEIIRSRFESIDRHYLSVRDAYKNHYDWLELDPLRHEISLCIIFGLCQAAITLTNHLLESLLKYVLMTKHFLSSKKAEREVKAPIVTFLIERYEEGRKLYEAANLSETINRACTSGLITKEQKRCLHQFREQFRNAYSHSDKRKTFGESTVPVTGVKLENEGLKTDETTEAKVAQLPVGQGLIQVWWPKSRHLVTSSMLMPWFGK